MPHVAVSKTKLVNTYDNIANEELMLNFNVFAFPERFFNVELGVHTCMNIFYSFSAEIHLLAAIRLYKFLTSW